MFGRYFKFFLPVITGLLLVLVGLVAAPQPSVANGFDFCEEFPFLCDGDFPFPSPSPSPSPCPDEIGLLNFLNVYASEDYDQEPSPSPCPEEPSPSPTPPPVGGGPSGEGGVAGGPQCPTDRPQQVDQVWFTDKKPGEVTVNWANKGDAAGFHIAYGPAQNQLIWGVEVDDPKANQYTLKGLPDGDIWASVIAKSSKECGGPASETKTLAAVGTASSALLFLAGAGLITAGLWQAQRGLKRGIKKA
ncbi:fibronectin type III domain-containing protein [Candidatus Curtissbacteria bacterium]|nr:fibronectin type III domain-containing protein [Candidatus Curtissbacteria bacterium]